MSNRAVMAPMTRSRALGGVPNALMAAYYAQRSEAGLIVTEGTSPSPHGLGYPRIPGIFTAEQVDGWRLVTQSVHEAGSRIFLQLMDTGRVAHPGNLPEGADVRAPSAVPLERARIWVDGQGKLELPAPRAMSGGEVREAIDAYARAAGNALQAGFDGVELHGANGYLIEQFLNPHTNRRTDAWGGSVDGRLAFVTHVAAAVAGAAGPDRVGLRLSPFGTFNEMPHHPEIEETYVELARRMADLRLGYLHVVRPPAGGDPGIPRRIADAFGGTIILAGGFDLAAAEEAIGSGEADLIAFGRPFLANPDLVSRFALAAELNEPDPPTMYASGPEGYVDYPRL